MTDPLETRLQEALGGAYTLERELTGGGMSRVFVATERALGRTVVIKVLPPDLAAGVNRDRFKREIQVAAQLHHPHVVPLLAAGEHGDLLYYTMPYIEGESLGAAIARRGRLPVREVTRILTDVAEALAFAHARGVVHRDIKPGNILMQGPHALVTDFGVAKALSAALPSASGTTSGMVIGTPAYMAPEQLAADPSADHRVDLYALGLVAYEALTGASPFEGPSPRETMANQLTRMPPPLHTANPDVPAALAAIIGRCLQKDPALRPADAAAVVAELESLPPSVTRSPREKVAAAGLGVMLVAAVGISGLLVFRAANPDTGPAPGAGSLAIEVDTIPDTVIVREPAVLTREDSLAIARALAPRRQELRLQGAPEAVLESLRVQTERAVMDSLGHLIAMLRARGLVEGPPPPGQPPRQGSARGTAPPPTPTRGGVPAERPAVVFLPFASGVRGDPRVQAAVRDARDSLVRAVRAEGLYQVTDLDSLSRGAPGSMALATTLRNSTQILGRFQAQDDSLVLRLTIRLPGWPIGPRTVDLVGAPAPRGDPLATLGPLAVEVQQVLKRGTKPPDR